MKLLNSYGFGLCYHIAPLLEAVFEAGGFADARCWFLTGHTVTEVFYDGAYHYFDSDMMGYNVAGDGSFRGKPVVSVRDLERDGAIILQKLQTPDQVKPGVVDVPWYPGDVRERAMDGLAGLFTTTADNYLYPFTRYSPGHSMDFVLRPGEKLIRFFAPEEPGLFYLPYKFDGKRWSEFPNEVAEYHIRTADGPHSQKDTRLWATGRIEYTPPAPNQAVTVVDMPSPYVIIDARFTMRPELASESSWLRVDTSIDGGWTWAPAGELKGPHQGDWSIEPQVLLKSEHGRLTAVSGCYGYKMRITTSEPPACIRSLRLISRIQLNPRTLPSIQAGDNRFVYSTAPAVRRVMISTPLAHAPVHDLELVDEGAQEFLRPLSGKTGEVVYPLAADGGSLAGFDVGARFLDLRSDLAPDKLTAETRHTRVTSASGTASISWSIVPDGPFHELWHYPANLQWRDGDPIGRLLLWPEVFRQIRDLPLSTKRVYVKLRSSGPAIDNIRMAVYANAAPATGHLKIIQAWREGKLRKQHVEQIDAETREHQFIVRAGADIRNETIIFENE
jgi:hypothetical protein